MPCKSGAAKHEKIRVVVGQSVTRALPGIVKTISIADTDIADVVVAGQREVLINGKAIGLTSLVVWDDVNESTIFDVIVQGPFSDQQIDLQVKIAEFNRTKALEFGVDFYGATTDNGGIYEGASFGGDVAAATIPLSIFGGSAVEGLGGAFRYVSGKSELQVMVNAMMRNGILRVLAEPNVVAASGQSASFLSGGEVPVPIASTGTTGGSTVTIEWKEFGVKVEFLPTIVDSSIINLKVSPEVSSLDFNNGIQLSGFRVPALRTRKAETTVELKDGETLVIGGLIMEEEHAVVNRIPVLGHIPILGWLFSSRSTARSETELLMMVSPRITRALPRGYPPPKLSSDEQK